LDAVDRVIDDSQVPTARLDAELLAALNAER
jgi:hypothetical protein